LRRPAVEDEECSAGLEGLVAAFDEVAARDLLGGLDVADHALRVVDQHGEVALGHVAGGEPVAA
jgi:hypothetical protein